MNFKTLNILLLVTAFSLASCEDDVNDVTSTMNPLNQTSCILKKQTFNTILGANGETSEYNYNQDNLIEEIKRIQWSTVTSGNETEISQDSSFQYFEYSNNRAYKSTIKEGNNVWYYDYEYTDDLVTKKTVLYSDYSVQKYYTYKYDDENRLIEIRDSTNKVNFKYTFTYEDDNLYSYTIYDLGNTPQTKRCYIFSESDNKTNFSVTINGLPLVETIDMHSSFSKHNVSVEKYFSSISIDSIFNSPDVNSYEFEYNDEGLPLTRKTPNSTFTYEYYKID